MAKKDNIINKKFNSLKVVAFSCIKKTHAYWMCQCECGEWKEVRASHLKSGTIKSCGCLNRKRSSDWLRKYASSDKHKGANNPAWKGGVATYSAYHSWLDRNYLKQKCGHCGAASKKLDWALIKNKKHEHNRKNYLTLCRSCHITYDKK